ncbi:MAG: response regulator transcription factor [Flavobacteriales bacterium]|nr:response regulator transcription factor [Flavobacteriales bacterium]
MPIRTAIVEDDPTLRAAMERVVGSEGNLQLMGSFSSAEAFLGRPRGLEDLDVVLMDINLPGMSGIACITECKPRRPQVQYLVCTIFEDNGNLFNALRAGATGYLLKSAEPEQVVRSIHEIHNGGSPMSLHIARMLVESVPRKQSNSSLLESLTKREREVLDQLAGGYRYKEIAERLDLKIDTVRSYIRDIYTKLQVQSRTDALNKAPERQIPFHHRGTDDRFLVKRIPIVLSVSPCLCGWPCSPTIMRLMP